MNTFKKKALTAAVLGTLGVAGSAHAIYRDANNLGQALIYPYYTVQSVSNGGPIDGSFNTYISVVNTTADVKVVKVRFREGKASSDATDFNVYLSPHDVWTAAVIPASSDPASGAVVVSSDRSCVNPGGSGALALPGHAFVNYDYTGLNDDGQGSGIDRTREGYIEILEMGVILPGAAASAATHSATGTPSCAGLSGDGLLAGILAPGAGTGLTQPSGGLSGTGTLINVNAGLDVMYNAVALGDFAVGGNVYADPGSASPNLSSTTPPVALVHSGATSYLATFVALTADAASATLMHTDAINEYILDSATASDTDWVFTFPTKNFYVAAGAASAVTPFTEPLVDGAGACESVAITFRDREEQTTSIPTQFSPPPPTGAGGALCWESTVLSFRNGLANAPQPGDTTSLVLGSKNTSTLTLKNFQNGWADITFNDTNATTTGVTAAGGTTFNALATPGALGAGPITFLGLPVVGFMVRTFSNGTLSCGTASCQGNYSGLVNHAFKDGITPAPTP